MIHYPLLIVAGELRVIPLSNCCDTFENGFSQIGQRRLDALPGKQRQPALRHAAEFVHGGAENEHEGQR